jgi:thiol:disulfide interchange protein DsbA
MRKSVLIVGLMLAMLAGWAGAVELKEGKNYTVLNPARSVDAKDRIEVTEFFWYGCGHCFNMEPILQKWLKTLPKDVTFRRIPAVFPDKSGAPGAWAPLARLYYALDAMGILDKLHGEVFDAVHIDRVNLNDPRVLGEWATSKGIDKQKLMDAMSSFAVQGKVVRSIQLSGEYGVNGVPALFVNGRYALQAGEAGSHEEVVAILDKLIDKARKERNTKK